MKKEYIDTKKEIKDPDPIIEFTQEAWRKIKYVIDKCSQEVGWLGSVEKIEDAVKNPYHFRITNIWVPQQEVNGGTCEIKPAGRDALLQELFDSAPTPKDGMDLTNSIRYWGHSHVNMGVFASGQDDAQILEMRACPWYIRGIHNKKGEINLALYVFSENVVYRDIQPVILDSMPDSEKESLDKQIKENVKQKTYTSTSSYYYGGKSYDPNGFDSTIHFFENQPRHGGHHIMWAPGADKTMVRKRFKNAASYEAYKQQKKSEPTVTTSTPNFGDDEYYDEFYTPYYGGCGGDYYNSYNKPKTKPKPKSTSNANQVVRIRKLDPITGDFIDEILNPPQKENKQMELNGIEVSPDTIQETEVWNKQKQCWEKRIIK
jgi:hypothetical protein